MFEDINKILLITDMDGTLLPASKIPGKKNLAAIERFKGDGGKFSIATGRSIQAMRPYFSKINVNCPAIMCNGGMVYDILNKKQIYDIYLPEKSKDFTKQILLGNPDIGCEVLSLDGVYVPQMNQTEKEHCQICDVTPILCDINDIPDNRYKILFAQDPSEISRLVDYVEQRDFIGVDFVISAPQYYEMLPQNICKGAALEVMRAACGMEDYTIVAVGDYNNDIEMIKYADVGICPSNATDDVKAAADIVLDVSCEEDAIAAVIDHIYQQF